MRHLLALVLFVSCTANVTPNDAGTGGGSATGGGSVTGGGSAAGGGSATGGGSASGGGGGSTSDGGPAGAPVWRRGLVKWQWVEIPNTSLQSVPVTNPFNSMPERPNGRIDAWNGFAANRDTNRVYLAAAGGHADWAGNEVYEIDLSIDAPTWRILRGPSPGNTISIGVNYNSDGRPASTHLYYALTFVRSKQRIFKLSAGSVWGSGNESNSNVDGFDLTTNDWDPMATWAAGMPHGGAIDRPYAHHPLTDDSYTFFSGAFRKWTSSTATWTSLAARPSYANDDIVQGSSAAVDTLRDRVLFPHNAYKVAMKQGLLLTAAGALTDVTFTGAVADEVTGTQTALHYFATEDVFLMKAETAGALYRIEPTTFAVTEQPTTGTAPPDAVNGIYTRFQWLPLLGGFAYVPRASSNFWFLATE